MLNTLQDSCYCNQTSLAEAADVVDVSKETQWNAMKRIM